MPDVELKVHSGICGFSTVIRASSEDGQTVKVDFTTTCPHLEKAREQLRTIDAYTELFRKPHETASYAALSQHLPHTACPLYSGFLKAIEASAGLALRKDVTMTWNPPPD
ncbi:MAG TPA: hypothetical protein VMQ10_00435 [Spirochaetia bacterium]|nr:hypothetical protein [Spirochaetia bacterium]